MMAEYAHLGDPSPEWEEFVKNNVVATTGLKPGQSIEELQKATNAFRETASAQYLLESGIAKKIVHVDFQIPTQDGHSIPARVYRPKYISEDSLLPVYLYFHGGGFLFGTLSSEDANCLRIVAEIDIVVVNVCYRHTPQFKHPTQANDAWDAFQWVINHFTAIGGDPSQLIVGGTSAGGSLASTVVLRENKSNQRRVKGQVLCIPQLIHPGGTPPEVSSYHQHENAPSIPKSQLDLFGSILGGAVLNDTSLFVGNCLAEDVVGMPKTAFLVAGMDPLRDEALLYAKKLQSNGVLTKVDIFEGLPHGFYRYARLPSTNRWFSTVSESILWVLGSIES